MSDSTSSDFAPALSSTKQTSVSVTATATSSSSAWGTGDYKPSAKAADHDDPTGGRWLLCDGTAIDAAYTALIALVGGNRPDARGRTLVMQGTHADVSTLFANDGQAVANRRPKHRTSNGLGLNDPGHAHPIRIGSTNPGAPGAQDVTTDLDFGGIVKSATTGITLSGSIGTNNANDALDTPSYLVPGNLFIHT